MNDPAIPSTTRRRAWFFPAFVVGLLLLQITLCAAGVYVATRTNSFAVESDYYTKALHWDDEQAALRASAALGWKTTLTLAPDLATDNTRQLILTLRDSTGQPITNANITLLYFHHARAKDIQTITLTPLGETSGNYTARLPLTRPGRWEFRLSITHANDRYLTHDLRDLE